MNPGDSPLAAPAVIAFAIGLLAPMAWRRKSSGANKLCLIVGALGALGMAYLFWSTRGYGAMNDMLGLVVVGVFALFSLVALPWVYVAGKRASSQADAPVRARSSPRWVWGLVGFLTLAIAAVLLHQAYEAVQTGVAIGFGRYQKVCHKATQAGCYATMLWGRIAIGAFFALFGAWATYLALGSAGARNKRRAGP